VALLLGVVLVASSCSPGEADEPPESVATTTTLVSSTTTTSGGPTTTEVEARDLLDLGKDPLILFGAVPPMPPGADLPLPQGSADYFELFTPDADWSEAAARVDVFKLHAWQVRHFLDDEQLRLILGWLDDHDIPLMFETEPLQPPDPAECDHTESFEGPYDLEMARRIKSLGGSIAVVAIEEPYAFAHKLEGAVACRYTVERIVDEVIAYIDEMRSIFPGVPVGSIEPIWQSPPTTAADMVVWLETFEERSGEPFAFLHIDPDWGRPDWTQAALDIEQVADDHGVPFGVLYNGGLETEGRAWLQATMDHIAEFEEVAGGTPQHIAFQSWVDQPDRVLPDDDLGAFTSILHRYFGEVTEVQASFEPGQDEPGHIVGRLVDGQGQAIAGEPITVGIRPLSGDVQLHTVGGTVPSSARTAVIAVRVNVEEATPGEANVQLAGVAYEEETDGANLVSNPDFGSGLRDWGVYGEDLGEVRVATDAHGDPQLVMSATSSQQIWIDTVPFEVTPGASYEFRASIGVPEESIGTATVSVAFLGEGEVGRATIRFEPVLALEPPITTDEMGVVRVPTEGLSPGRYEVFVQYAGSLERWPSSGTVVLEVS
jgi:hypothetical protein